MTMTEFSEEYRIYWRGSRPGLIGYVRNFTVTGEQYREVPITRDDEFLAAARMRFAVLRYVDRNPEIVVSHDLVRMDRVLRDACIWHEMGHVHHEHMLQSTFSSQDEVREARMSAVRSGAVLEEEAQADDFAVSRAGRESFVAYLKYLLRTRPRDTEMNRLGARELELRISRALKAVGPNKGFDRDSRGQ